MHLDYSVLQNSEYQQYFVDQFKIQHSKCSTTQNINEILLNINSCIHSAAVSSIPIKQYEKKCPWISSYTLTLIEEHDMHRRNQDAKKEKRIGKIIKTQVKLDKEAYLNSLLEKGEWTSIHKYKKAKKKQSAQMTLRTAAGEDIPQEKQANAMAEHFELKQWHFRDGCGEHQNKYIFESRMPMTSNEITLEELRKIIKKLKNGKATGIDQIPPEIWKAISKDEDALALFCHLCNKCWQSGRIPISWHKASVVTIFKKGNNADMNNYRPISLLQISYKIFAALILKRLTDMGAEERIWNTQFGFRNAYGTNDARCMIRRIMNKALASKNEKVIILALDWAKAFDSISPSSLCHALLRFGIDPKITRLIQDIYSNRIFRVQLDGQQSDFHSQHFGISQGCPLSPFLFSILMTVMLHDCRTHFNNDFPEDLMEFLYADDTLLIGKEPHQVQKYMNAIAIEGKRYGLLLNLSKLKMMQINCDVKIKDAAGNDIEKKESMKYLGALLHKSGKIDSELGRRLGMAKSEFTTLAQIWKNTNTKCKRKIQLYRALILSKLMYGLQTAWISKQLRKRLDAFHYECLRKTLNIPHAYVSRITNAEITKKAQMPTVSNLRLRQQLLYFGKIARNYNHPARRIICKEETMEIKRIENKRRGRPNLSWTVEVSRHAQLVKGDILQSKEWHKAIIAYCSNL